MHRQVRDASIITFAPDSPSPSPNTSSSSSSLRWVQLAALMAPDDSSSRVASSKNRSRTSSGDTSSSTSRARRVNRPTRCLRRRIVSSSCPASPVDLAARSTRSKAVSRPRSAGVARTRRVRRWIRGRTDVPLYHIQTHVAITHEACAVRYIHCR